MTLREKLVAAITALFLGVALLRGLLLWQHEPLIGLANNYDMIRVQGCIDAYPIRSPEIPPWSNSWEGPLERYSFRDDVDPGCFLTSEALFAFAALPLLRYEAARSGDGGFSLRTIGGIKLLLLAVAVVAVTLALRRSGATAAGLVNAAVAAFVLFDPGVTIYLNTMYAEFSAVVFAYIAIGSICVALVGDRPQPVAWVIAMAAIVLADTSKVQHLAFGLVLLGALLVVHGLVRKVPRGLMAAVAVGALVGLVVQLWHLQTPMTQSMRRANLTNTVLQAVLGSSANPAQTAVELGLPERCGTHAGKTWFSEDVQAQHPCPELFELGRVRILAVLVSSPATFSRFLVTGLSNARPWIHPLLGKVEGGVSEPVPASFVSLDRPIARLPGAIFAGLFVLPVLIAGGLSVRRRRACAQHAAFAFVLMACATYALFSWFTILLGDGFADVAKQFHLGMTMWLCFWLVLVLGALLRMGRRGTGNANAASSPVA